MGERQKFLSHTLTQHNELRSVLSWLTLESIFRTPLGTTKSPCLKSFLLRHTLIFSQSRFLSSIHFSKSFSNHNSMKAMLVYTGCTLGHVVVELHVTFFYETVQWRVA